MHKLISEQLKINTKQIKSAIDLFNNGATIPFIARYRKEQTGGLDEIELEQIQSSQKKFLELEKRKTVIFERLDVLGIKDAAFLQKIKTCFDPKQLEDLYLPYKPKRKTKASIAKEKGLEPLAKIIMSQRDNNIQQQCKRFLQKGISEDEALQGARDIIAEWINEHAYTRKRLRSLYQSSALLIAKVVEKNKAKAIKYKDYFSFEQALKKIPSHRFLAINRAEKEGLLKIKISIDSDYAVKLLEEIFIKNNGPAAEHIDLAIKDSFKRLLSPSLENEVLKAAKEIADEEAIQIFSKNLSQLLLAPPLGAKRTLALDPGFKSGCKLVCLDAQGNLLEHSNIFPHPPQNNVSSAAKTINHLIDKYQIQAIAIGNGTAGRETERFVKNNLNKSAEVEIFLINEDGASIYSASEIGRQEFPDLDLTVRGSISIGRRLIDPLSELVKIEAKSIGVGQYQHDVAQDKLKNSLNNTVTFAVNKVGVNLNTASQHLLQYIAGIGPKLAENIVNQRAQTGPFKNRKALLKVKGMGNKAFQQAAGFLRIKAGDNALDATAVHPESYKLVQLMAKQHHTTVDNLIQNKEICSTINLNEFVTSEIGLPTLKDILDELNKPGLDPRGTVTAIQFDDNIQSISDLHTGMILTGKISNLTKFGAFVDLGIKQNGLIHKSQIANRFVEDPADFLQLEQQVKVVVVEIDIERNRIQLSMKLDKYN